MRQSLPNRRNRLLREIQALTVAAKSSGNSTRDQAPASQPVEIHKASCC